MQKVDSMPDIKGGRYKPVSVLGTGTYGQVLECYDCQMNSPVAVKVARPEAAYRRSALNESRVLANLSASEDVMDIHESFEEDGRVYIVGEMLHKNMYEVLKDRKFKEIPLEDVRQVARVVLRALRDLHNMNYMHCDIKPENVMLKNNSGDFSQTCMIDFGAVRKLNENQYFDIQSLWYRAPEVICGVPYTPQIDSWSVGCLLYELHTGNPLFPGDSAQSQLNAIMEVVGRPSEQAMTSGKYAERLTFEVPPESPTFNFVTKINGPQDQIELFNDLLRQMLCPDERYRLSCKDALMHPFVVNRPDESSPLVTCKRPSFSADMGGSTTSELHSPSVGYNQSFGGDSSIGTPQKGPLFGDAVPCPMPVGEQGLM